jgi:hypothetical protein
MKFPEIPRMRGGVITLKDTIVDILRWLRAKQITSVVGGNLKETPNGTTLYIDKASIQNSTVAATPPPFWPTLYTTTVAEVKTYEVSVKDGWLTERLRLDYSEGVVRHLPDNIKDAVDATNQRKFAILADEVLYAKYDVEINGSVTPDTLTLEVNADDFESTPYQPKCGDFAGSTGTYYIPLCQLKVADEKGTIIPINTGHIGHVSERGEINNTSEAAPSYDADTGSEYGRVIKEYKPDEDTYLARVLTARQPSSPVDPDEPTAQIQIVENADDVVIQGNGQKFSVSFEGPGANEDKPLVIEDGLGISGDGEEEDPNITVLLPEFESPDETIAITYEPGIPLLPESTWKLEGGGVTLKIEIYSPTVISSFEGDAADIDYSGSSTPFLTLYFFHGILYTSEPTGFPSSPTTFRLGTLDTAGLD